MFLKNINLCLLIMYLCSANCQDQELTEGSQCWAQEKNGTCVNLYKCTSAAAYLDFSYTGQVGAIKNITQPEVCSYRQDGEPIVCCTDCKLDDREFYRTNIVLWNGAPYDKPKKSKAFDKCMEYIRELPYNCQGQTRDTFTLHYNHKLRCHNLNHQTVLPGYGGNYARRNQFPHMALLGYGDDRESAQWLCGGAVISDRFILTAAHCSSTAANVSVSFAALGILTRSEVSDFWKVYKIKRIIVYPQYKPPSKYHDIALLETVNEINFGVGLLPACLDVNIWRTLAGYAPGWGRLGPKARLAEHLMVMHLWEYNDTLCASRFPPHRHLKRGYDAKTQMCFGNNYEVVDTCEGDSGGPLQEDVAECMYIVIGVTSYGKSCAIPGNAGMYTRVRHYVPWIESIVWPDSFKRF